MLNAFLQSFISPKNNCNSNGVRADKEKHYCNSIYCVFLEDISQLEDSMELDFLNDNE